MDNDESTATRSYARSAALRETAMRLTPGAVHSNVRLSSPSVFFERGKGAWLWDVDGNDYVDYLLGQGPNFLGHAHEGVLASVDSAMRRGTVFGAQHVLENEAAQLLIDTVGWAEQVRFGVSGTESDQAALRVARAATGRHRYVRFEGHYHGWLDNVLVATAGGRSGPASKGQDPHALDAAIFVPFNDAAALDRAFDEFGDDIAAVICEPMMCNNGAIPPEPGFLQHIRELCTRNGTVFILDEVITGFRLAPGGGAEYFGITPDLAVYGKALAGGWPVSALAGSAELMGLFAQGVNHSGTFNASVPACAAVIGALSALRDDPPYAKVADHGSRLMAGLAGIGRARDLPLRIQGLPMAFHVGFGTRDQPARSYSEVESLDLARYAALATDCFAEGLWVAPRGIWYTSAAHGDAELDAALERFDAAVARSLSRAASESVAV